ncbi:MAG TPA: phosphomannomutase/phosphoglucomutase, partial [Steroidobacteraceae bacterium]
ASHNPSDHNGFKVLLGTEPVYGTQLQALIATEPESAPGGCVQEMSIRGAYVQRLAALGAGMRGMNVVWDCGNGSVGAVIEELTSRLPGRHVLLNVEVDGRFPAHHPDPSVAENLYQLQSAVREQGAELGIAFDGDGDRIGIVDENGSVFDSDHLLLLLATDVLAQQPGAAIVADVKCSSVLFDGIVRRGGRPVMAPSGYVHVREAMLRERAPLAGEMSGHVFFADCWCRTDDALYVAMRTLGALSRMRCTIESFRASLPATASTSEIRLSCPEERKAAVVREVGERVAMSGATMNCADGIRVTTESGWWLLRASGTESRLTVRCEAVDPYSLEKLCLEVIRHLEASGVPCAREIAAAMRPWRSGERRNL